MFLDAILAGRNPPGEVNVLIEIPLGGEPVKYELDKNAGILVVDRFLYTPMRYPGNYGFVPHTLSGDGDPCDVIIRAAAERGGIYGFAGGHAQAKSNIFLPLQGSRSRQMGQDRALGKCRRSAADR